MEDFLLFLQNMQMKEPTRWGFVHIFSISIAFVLIAITIYKKRKGYKPNPKLVISIYAISTFILELTKQLMLAVVREDDLVYWSFSYYSAPFQFCTMPLYACLILMFVKNEKVKDYLYCFLGLYSIVSMISVAFYPDTCFTESVLMNIHTMVLHFGGLVVSIYVLINELIKFNIKSLLKGLSVFLICVLIAFVLDIVVYNLTSGEVDFNMFYISPYFDSVLPVFCDIKKVVPYPIFLIIYIAAVSLGALIILTISKIINKFSKKEYCYELSPKS